MGLGRRINVIYLHGNQVTRGEGADGRARRSTSSRVLQYYFAGGWRDAHAMHAALCSVVEGKDARCAHVRPHVG